MGSDKELKVMKKKTGKLYTDGNLLINSII